MKKTKFFKNLFLLLSLFLGGLGSAHAEEYTLSEEKTSTQIGLEIARLVDDHDKGWINQIADVKMVLKNQQDQTSIRKMKIKTLEVTGEGDKSLVLFKTPRDIRGTAFLSFTHSVGSDDQWLYLPALGRVKRISSHNKSGPFMGSEFAYEDISSQELDKYTYLFLKEVNFDGKEGYLLERYPVDKNSGYSKQVLWIDSKYFLIHRVDYYDRKKALLKTLEYKDYQQYFNEVWRPRVMAVVNQQTNKSTELIWENYRFNTNITKRDFDKSALKRMR